MESLEQLLAEHPFLQGMSPKHLGRLAECAETRQFAAGLLLFREGEEVKEFFLVRHGQVTMEMSFVGLGAFWEAVPLGSHFNLGPVVEYTRMFSITMTSDVAWCWVLASHTSADPAEPVLGQDGHAAWPPSSR